MPDFPAGAGEQRELLVRLRAVVEAKDAEVAMLGAELTAERELRSIVVQWQEPKGQHDQPGWRAIGMVPLNWAHC